jgi:uncharacterized protein DUF3300
MQPWIRRVAPRVLPIALAVMLASPTLPRAQQPPPPQQPAAPQPPAQQAQAAQQPGDDDVQPFKPEELEAIVAPIALYPDPLVAQVLMASTYPLEVIQAARLMKSQPNLKGDALNEELKKHEWDDSVKSLCSFPQTLEVLNEKIDWMQKLGDAFLDQRKETMDAIQRMRAKAQAQGNLQSNEQQKVIVEAAPAQAPAQAGQPAPAGEQTVIKIEPASPQVVYVPQYNPTVVYGPPPPAYPPYYYPYPPGYAWGAAAISFGVGMAVGAAVWGGCNWGGGDVDIDVNKSNNFTNNVNRGDRATQIKNERASRGQGQGQGGRQSFNHDPSHRKGAQYRDKGTQQKYNRASSPQAGSRDSYRGRGDQGGGGRGGAGQGGPSASTRDAGGGGRSGQGGPSASTRDAAGGGQRGGGGGREAGAFDGMGQGGQQRANSQRGQSSVSSSRASGYSGGGGGSRGGGGGGVSSGGGSRGGGGFSGGGGGGGSRGGGGGGGRGGGGGGRR